MALSNWDTLAVDEKGEPSDGRFTSPLGVEVEIYKNWLYVRDEKAWRDGGHFVEPTIMSIDHGQLIYCDVSIYAVRGPKNGIYLAVWTGYAHEPNWKAMVGIGLYGYDDRRWIGVQAADIRYLEVQLKADAVPQELGALDFAKAVRFNQGDRYFAEKVRLEPPSTPPGASEDPLLNQLIDDMKKKP
ncbi:MAG: hypothetical protein ACRD1X_13560 [Vicinamibacteria bacterium]